MRTFAPETITMYDRLPVLKSIFEKSTYFDF